MKLSISQINFKPVFKNDNLPLAKNQEQPVTTSKESKSISVYGNDEIRTNPTQLSLFHMHDFHGQNIRMERAHSAVQQFDRGTLTDQNNNTFDKNMPVDKLKLCSGDMFLGENKKELGAVNEFLNIAGITANTIGNHECDEEINSFAKIVQNRKYHLLGANMHPQKNCSMDKLLSNSIIAEVNGNKYGIIGLVPVDMKNHMKRPEDVKEFNISDKTDTLRDLQNEIAKIKSQGVNKIIVLSHLGLESEQYIAQNVSDIDVILGGHTHNLIKEVKEGENLFKSPKGEPVLIMQVGRDGEFIGMPNIKFNELGQITDIQYNLLKTDDFARSLIAKQSFETILGKPEVVGKIASVEEPPKDIYANENPHCDFILDCMRNELNTDIAAMNSANIRGRFYKGEVDTRDLLLISPFANNVTVIEATEAELINSLNGVVKSSMESPVHRPGILQVSGLRYEYSKSKGEITALSFIDKNNIEHPIDIKNPSQDKIYTIAVDDYCAKSTKSGMNLAHRLEDAKAFFDCDKDVFVAGYLRKHKEPVSIKSDGRIKVVD